MLIAESEVNMEKKQIVVEYKMAVATLKRVAKSEDKRLAEGAKKILGDKKLFAEYLAKRIEDRQKKLAKKDTKPSIWNKCFGFLGK